MLILGDQMKKSGLVLILPVVLFVVSCGFELPIKELAAAKKSISSASGVEAQKYAPEEYLKSSEFLIKAHENIRDEKTEDSRKNAEESLKYSQAAYEKSLPLWSESYLVSARKKVEEMKALGAEKYAKADADSAESALSASETFFKDENYINSKIKSEEASKLASNAIKRNNDASKSVKGELLERINQLRASVSELEKEGAKAAYRDKFDSIGNSISAAESLINSSDFEKAAEEIQKAELLRDEVTSLYSNKRKSATDSIAAVENEIQAMKQSGSYDLSKPQSILSEAKEYFKKMDYETCENKCDEALSIIDSMKLETSKSDVIEKAVDAKTEVKDGDGFPKEYTVKLSKGNRDCLWKIAGSFYGKRYDLWPLIFIANKDKIKDPDLIFPGQKLIIPSPEMYYRNEKKSGESDSPDTLKSNSGGDVNKNTNVSSESKDLYDKDAAVETEKTDSKAVPDKDRQESSPSSDIETVDSPKKDEKKKIKAVTVSKNNKTAGSNFLNKSKSAESIKAENKNKSSELTDDSKGGNTLGKPLADSTMTEAKDGTAHETNPVNDSTFQIITEQSGK